MRVFLIFSLIITIVACSGPKQNLKPQQTAFMVKDGHYDSEFPLRPVSEHLERLTQAVKLISTMTFYKAYQFSLEDRITKDDLNDPQIFNKAGTTYIFQRPASGTASLISQNNRELLFLTCNHIVNHPDTLLSYYSKKSNPREASPFLHSASIKIKETLNIVNIPSGSQPVLLSFDKANDLALVGVKLHRMPGSGLPVMNLPFGKAADLRWGTFIYLISYPQGKLMLSNSLVSQPNRDAKHNFLFNSSLTRGISGGIVIAIKDGVPNFEIVGIASALGAQTQYYLRPDLNKASWMFDSNQPYKGEIFIDQQVGNNSGIVFAVASENIVNFIKKSKEKIEQKGFHFPFQRLKAAR